MNDTNRIAKRLEKLEEKVEDLEKIYNTLDNIVMYLEEKTSLQKVKDALWEVWYDLDSMKDEIKRKKERLEIIAEATWAYVKEE